MEILHVFIHIYGIEVEATNTFPPDRTIKVRHRAILDCCDIETQNNYQNNFLQ